MDDAAHSFAPLQRLAEGEFAPWFVAPTAGRPTYGFHTVAGRYVLIGFLPNVLPDRAHAFLGLSQNRARFNDTDLTCFLVVRDQETIQAAQNQVPGLRWLFDPDGEVSRLYGALDEAGRESPHWLLLDPSLRVLARAPLDTHEIFELIARLPPPADHAGVPMHAPVLIVPRIFEPDVCRRLIALYESQGGQPSGVMRDIGGRTVGVLDDMKSRRDLHIADEELRRELFLRIQRRLFPEVAKAYQFRPTRLERFVVACYDAVEGGYFRPHRDNQTLATRHRRFAVSINLNSEGFEGGDLRFPEFGPRTYRPPTGGAVVFCCTLLHEATPVTRGRRYAFLPFLYDEEGARIRQEGEAFLDVQSGGRAEG